jgi:AbrB family looped-hinge helix DNA binding protein
METTIDKAGRVVVPKSIRDRLRFRPGTSIALELTAEGLLLRAASRETSLVWRDGLPVLTGEPLPGVDWERLIEDERDERMRKLAAP